jgi:hypothetical protein
MKGFFIDFSQLEKVRQLYGATRGQMVAAFNKALRQTSAAAYRESARLMKAEIKPNQPGIIRGRILRFTSRASSSQPGKGKIWFGLDDVPVSSIKGNITSLELQRQRDAK